MFDINSSTADHYRVLLETERGSRENADKEIISLLHDIKNRYDIKLNAYMAKKQQASTSKGVKSTPNQPKQKEESKGSKNDRANNKKKQTNDKPGPSEKDQGDDWGASTDQANTKDQADDWGASKDQADDWGATKDETNGQEGSKDQADDWATSKDQANGWGNSKDQDESWGASKDQTNGWADSKDQADDWGVSKSPAASKNKNDNRGSSKNQSNGWGSPKDATTPKKRGDDRTASKDLDDNWGAPKQQDDDWGAPKRQDDDWGASKDQGDDWGARKDTSSAKKKNEDKRASKNSKPNENRNDNNGTSKDPQTTENKNDDWGSSQDPPTIKESSNTKDQGDDGWVQQISYLQSQLSLSRDDNTKLKKRNARLEKDLSHARILIRTLREGCSLVEDQAKTFESRHDTIMMTKAELERELIAIKEESSRHITTINNLQKSNEQISKAFIVSVEAHEACKRELDVLQQKYSRKIESYQIENMRLNQANSQLRKLVEYMQK